MATMIANGHTMFTYGMNDPDRFRLMSNGVILKRRPGAGFRKTGKLKPGLTFQAAADIFTKSGLTVLWEVGPLERSNLPRPSPRKRRASLRAVETRTLNEELYERYSKNGVP